MADLDPSFNWQTEDEIRESLFQEGKTRLPAVTNYNSGGVFRTFLELVASAVYSFYVLLSNVIKQAFVQYATADWLDLKAGEVGLSRKAATKTAGGVYFIRENTTGNVVIPAGSIVSTATDSRGNSYRYITSGEVVLVDGTTEVYAPVTAEFEGAAFNVGTGSINRMISALSGIDYVSNRDGWIVSEGTDTETDPDLRARYWLRCEELARGATKMAYVGYAQEVNGVVDVEVDDNFPRGMGTVDVYITGTAGLPTQTLVDAVQAVVDDKKPICSDALVKAPAALTIDAAVTVEMLPGEPTAGVQTDALAILNALFIKSADYADLEDLRLRIGWDVTEDAFITALKRRIPGIKRINCGFDTIPVAISEIATPGTITVTVSEALEY